VWASSASLPQLEELYILDVSCWNETLLDIILGLCRALCYGAACCEEQKRVMTNAGKVKSQIYCVILSLVAGAL